MIKCGVCNHKKATHPRTVILKLNEFVITNELSIPGLRRLNEMICFYKASCSSTHFRSRDLAIFGSRGHLYEEM